VVSRWSSRDEVSRSEQEVYRSSRERRGGFPSRIERGKGRVQESRTPRVGLMPATQCGASGFGWSDGRIWSDTHTESYLGTHLHAKAARKPHPGHDILVDDKVRLKAYSDLSHPDSL
jgi:hypothetical protein